MVDILQSINPKCKRRIVHRLEALRVITSEHVLEKDSDGIEYVDQFFEEINLSKRCDENFDRLENLENIEGTLLNHIFNPEGQPPKRRFSDGFPVLYSALEEETAEEEIRYWDGKLFEQKVSPDEPVCRVLYSLEFYGHIKDLRSFYCPKLTQNMENNGGKGYKFCQQLGKKAVKEGLAGLFVPSARRVGGTNVPVFTREALSNLRLQYRADIRYNPETQKICIQKRDI